MTVHPRGGRARRLRGALLGGTLLRSVPGVAMAGAPRVEGRLVNPAHDAPIITFFATVGGRTHLKRIANQACRWSRYRRCD